MGGAPVELPLDIPLRTRIAANDERFEKGTITAVNEPPPPSLESTAVSEDGIVYMVRRYGVGMLKGTNNQVGNDPGCFLYATRPVLPLLRSDGSAAGFSSVAEPEMLWKPLAFYRRYPATETANLPYTVPTGSNNGQDFSCMGPVLAKDTRGAKTIYVLAGDSGTGTVYRIQATDSGAKVNASFSHTDLIPVNSNEYGGTMRMAAQEPGLTATGGKGGRALFVNLKQTPGAATKDGSRHVALQVEDAAGADVPMKHLWTTKLDKLSKPYGALLLRNGTVLLTQGTHSQSAPPSAEHIAEVTAWYNHRRAACEWARANDNVCQQSEFNQNGLLQCCKVMPSSANGGGDVLIDDPSGAGSLANTLAFYVTNHTVPNLRAIDAVTGAEKWAIHPNDAADTNWWGVDYKCRDATADGRTFVQVDRGGAIRTFDTDTGAPGWLSRMQPNDDAVASWRNATSEIQVDPSITPLGTVAVAPASMLSDGGASASREVVITAGMITRLDFQGQYSNASNKDAWWANSLEPSNRYLFTLGVQVDARDAGTGQLLWTAATPMPVHGARSDREGQLWTQAHLTVVPSSDLVLLVNGIYEFAFSLTNGARMAGPSGLLYNQLGWGEWAPLPLPGGFLLVSPNTQSSLSSYVNSAHRKAYVVGCGWKLPESVRLPVPYSSVPPGMSGDAAMAPVVRLAGNRNAEQLEQARAWEGSLGCTRRSSAVAAQKLTVASFQGVEDPVAPPAPAVSAPQANAFHYNSNRSDILIPTLDVYQKRLYVNFFNARPPSSTAFDGSEVDTNDGSDEFRSRPEGQVKDYGERYIQSPRGDLVVMCPTLRKAVRFQPKENENNNNNQEGTVSQPVGVNVSAFSAEKAVLWESQLYTANRNACPLAFTSDGTGLAGLLKDYIDGATYLVMLDPATGLQKAGGPGNVTLAAQPLWTTGNTQVEEWDVVAYNGLLIVTGDSSVAAYDENTLDMRWYTLLSVGTKQARAAVVARPVDNRTVVVLEQRTSTLDNPDDVVAKQVRFLEAGNANNLDNLGSYASTQEEQSAPRDEQLVKGKRLTRYTWTGLVALDLWSGRVRWRSNATAALGVEAHWANASLWGAGNTAPDTSATGAAGHAGLRPAAVLALDAARSGAVVAAFDDDTVVGFNSLTGAELWRAAPTRSTAVGAAARGAANFGSMSIVGWTPRDATSTRGWASRSDGDEATERLAASLAHAAAEPFPLEQGTGNSQPGAEVLEAVIIHMANVRNSEGGAVVGINAANGATLFEWLEPVSNNVRTSAEPLPYDGNSVPLGYRTARSAPVGVDAWYSPKFVVRASEGWNVFDLASAGNTGVNSIGASGGPRFRIGQVVKRRDSNEQVFQQADDKTPVMMVPDFAEASEVGRRPSVVLAMNNAQLLVYGCGEHAAGRHCDRCVEGHFKFRNKCIECPDLVPLFLLGGLIFFIGFVYLVSRKPSSAVEKVDADASHSEETEGSSLARGDSAKYIRPPTGKEEEEDEEDEEAQKAREEEEEARTRGYRRTGQRAGTAAHKAKKNVITGGAGGVKLTAPKLRLNTAWLNGRTLNLLGPLQQFVHSAQVLSVFFSINISFPVDISFFRMMRLLNLANLSVEAAGPECIFGADNWGFSANVASSVIVPFVVLVCFGIVYGAVHLHATRTLTGEKLQQRLTDMRSLVCRLVLNLLTFGFVPVSVTAMRTLDCQPISATESLLEGEPDIVCGSAQWAARYLPSLIGGIVFSIITIAVLVYVVVRLGRVRTEIKHGVEPSDDDVLFVERFGMVADNYRPGMSGWELFILGRKLLFGALVYMVSAFPTHVSAMLAAFTLLTVPAIVLASPFNARVRNALEAYLYFVMFMCAAFAPAIASSSRNANEICWNEDGSEVVECGPRFADVMGDILTTLCVLALFFTVVVTVMMSQQTKEEREHVFAAGDEKAEEGPKEEPLPPTRWQRLRRYLMTQEASPLGPSADRRKTVKILTASSVLAALSLLLIVAFLATTPEAPGAGDSIPFLIPACLFDVVSFYLSWIAFHKEKLRVHQHGGRVHLSWAYKVPLGLLFVFAFFLTMFIIPRWSLQASDLTVTVETSAFFATRVVETVFQQLLTLAFQALAFYVTLVVMRNGDAAVVDVADAVVTARDEGKPAAAAQGSKARQLDQYRTKAVELSHVYPRTPDSSRK